MSEHGLGILLAALGLALATAAGPALAADVEPGLRLPGALGNAVALTFDACSGHTDRRILDALINEGVPATLFVTARWLRRNADAVALIAAHPDLFEVEDHGAAHVPAVTDRTSLFGLPTAGSIAGVDAEVTGGADAIVAAFGDQPTWFRGAGARYSRDAVSEIGALGYRIAGYSLNADVGASLSAKAVERRIAAARPGDVVIAHINQPDRPSGDGVVAGIRALKARGFRFVRLDDAFGASAMR